MDSTSQRHLVDQLLDEALEDVDHLTDLVVAAIRSRARSLADFPYDQHIADSVLSIRTMLIGLRIGEGPTADALEHAAAIGRDRARFGIPLVDAIEGYHVAAAEIWGYLFDRANRRGPAWVAELSGAVAPLWAMINRTSTSFTTAHATETARLAAGQHQVRSRLVALLREEDPHPGLATALIEQLGFEAEEAFTVLLSTQTTPSTIDSLQEQLDELPGVAHCSLDEDARAVLIGQHLDLVATANAMHELTGVAVGVGLPRAGVRGAALSLSDADLALAATSETRPVIRFADDWVTAVFASESHRIEPLLRSGVQAARENPHLASAVTAFATHRFSLTAAAQALHVHPNTTKYRLARWEELTGWDVLTGDGLIASLIAIELSDHALSDPREHSRTADTAQGPSGHQWNHS